jgi:hypothetical protein
MLGVPAVRSSNTDIRNRVAMGVVKRALTAIEPPMT